MSEERDFSSPYDEVFDTFFATGVKLSEDGSRMVGGTARQDSTLSWARNSAANFSNKIESKKTGQRGDYDRTSVYGAYRFWWDKETKDYYIPADSLEKMAQVLIANGYGVTEPEN